MSAATAALFVYTKKTPDFGGLLFYWGKKA